LAKNIALHNYQMALQNFDRNLQKKKKQINRFIHHSGEPEDKQQHTRGRCYHSEIRSDSQRPSEEGSRTCSVNVDGDTFTVAKSSPKNPCAWQICDKTFTVVRSDSADDMAETSGAGLDSNEIFCWSEGENHGAPGKKEDASLGVTYHIH
jgi:hypothetical protein